MTKKKRALKIISIAVLCILLVALGVILFLKNQMSKLPELTFDEALEYTTRNNKNAIITVGILKDGQSSFQVYGENGEELPEERHIYEIGSITKTFTASLISKAIQEDKINSDNTIDNYLNLPEGKHYPTIKQLLTHTSGYKAYYFEAPMISNFFAGRNDFYGISDEMLLKKITDINLRDKDYSFNYSNFGFAVLGSVLEVVYQQEYPILMNTYIHEELQLQNTKISDKSGDLGHYWDWREGDAYLSAGAITSDIADMLSYAQMQFDGSDYMKQCHESLRVINASNSSYKAMGINLDEIGMSWIIDKTNNLIWHNGGTGDYNSYIGFSPDSRTAVIVLSNLAPNYRIPATVLGIKLLQSQQ